VVELAVRLQHRVRVDRQLPDDLLDSGELIAGLQDTQPNCLPDLLHQLQMGGHPGSLVESKLDHVARRETQLNSTAGALPG
jgi:hypothetical protein